MADDVFSTDRPLFFSIAYRMLGSASDAEDVLQDAWLRYRSVDPATIHTPKALATTIVTRLCLDRLKSARSTRELYVGPWLPEPVLTSEVDDPHAVVQRAESVTLAFMVLLEKLSPEERAVFQVMIDEMFARFVGLIVEARKIPEARVRGFADGRIYTAEQARAMNLVDRLGYLDDAVAMAKEAAGLTDARVVMYHRPREYRANYYSASTAPPAAEAALARLAALVGTGPGFFYLWWP